jgi:hypothetical protein
VLDVVVASDGVSLLSDDFNALTTAAAISSWTLNTSSNFCAVRRPVR